jgi:hypothetical protein
VLTILFSTQYTCVSRTSIAPPRHKLSETIEATIISPNTLAKRDDAISVYATTNHMRIGVVWRSTCFVQKMIEGSPIFDVQPNWEIPLSIRDQYEDRANQYSGLPNNGCSLLFTRQVTRSLSTTSASHVREATRKMH